MQRIGFILLIAVFGVSTLSASFEEADACNNHETRESAPGDACCDAVDRSEQGPEAPCEQTHFHCCCVHSQAILASAAASGLDPVSAGLVGWEARRPAADPVVRASFHIPIA